MSIQSCLISKLPRFITTRYKTALLWRNKGHCAFSSGCPDLPL